MKLADYAVLLRAGMKLEEIREREAAEEREQDVDASNNDGLPDTSVCDTDLSDDCTDDNNGLHDTEEVDEPDYKALYEQSQKDLKIAQKANQNQNIEDPNKPTDEEEFAELVASFM